MPPPWKSRVVPEKYDPKYFEEEFAALTKALLEQTALELRPTGQVPVRPREGMIVYADGTNWNPGGGEGPYVYRNGVWKQFQLV